MKIKILQNVNTKEEEVIIRCRSVTPRIRKIADYVRQHFLFLEGAREGQYYHVSLEKIFYIDTVDRITFLYDPEGIYESKVTLKDLEQLLGGTSFVRISKNCILNITYLKCVEPYPNHRLRAILQNGETLIITRNYIGKVKERLINDMMCQTDIGKEIL